MKVAIGVPCLDTVQTSFFASFLNMERNGDDEYCPIIEAGSVTYEARNRIAEQAINSGADVLVWLDSDIVFTPDTIVRLVDHIKAGKDFVTGLYFRRNPQTIPLILRELDWRQDNKLGAIETAEIYEDYPRDSVFEIAGCGFGCCAMRVDILKTIVPAFKCSPFTPLYRLSEDYSFCWRAGKCGFDLWCDSSIKPAHAGLHMYTEQDWIVRKERAQNEV